MSFSLKKTLHFFFSRNIRLSSNLLFVKKTFPMKVLIANGSVSYESFGVFPGLNTALAILRSSLYFIGVTKVHQFNHILISSRRGQEKKLLDLVGPFSAILC